MRTIFKQRLQIVDKQVHGIQSDSKPLYFGVQDGEPTLWFECETESRLQPKNFYMIGTGGVVRPYMDYIGTIQLEGLVWHLYHDKP